MSPGCSEWNPQIILQVRRVSQQQLYPIAYRSSLAHQNHENREYTHNKDPTKTKSTRPSHEVHQASKIKNPKERINIGKGGVDTASPPQNCYRQSFKRYVSLQASPRRPSNPSPWTYCNQRIARDRYSVRVQPPQAPGSSLYSPRKVEISILSAPAAHLFLSSGFRWRDISSTLPGQRYERHEDVSITPSHHLHQISTVFILRVEG